MNKTIAHTTLMIILFFPIVTLAQLGGLPGDPGKEVPIDGGVTLLAGTAVAYGIKKLRDKRKP